MINYAENTQNWEKWQHEYKHGAFYIMPPNGVIEPMDELRRIHDPKSYQGCQAHISLSDPLTGPLTDQQFNEMSLALTRLSPFILKYGPIVTTPPYPGVCFDIAPREAFRQLRENIHATSLFKDNALKRRDIAPHITIAEFGLTNETSEKLKQHLQSSVDKGQLISEGQFICTHVEYLVPNNQFYFERVLRLPLGLKS